VVILLRQRYTEENTTYISVFGEKSVVQNVISAGISV